MCLSRYRDYDLTLSITASSHGSCVIASRSSGSGSIHDSCLTAVFTSTTSATPLMP